MDLTKVKGCYSKELRESCHAIKLMLNDPNTDTTEMIRVVKEIIAPAFIEAAAKKRFTKNLEACTTKEDVDNLCHEAVMNGMWYKANRKRRVVA